MRRRAGDGRRWGWKTNHRFYGLFQSAPDLITLVLPGSGATASLGADSPGDALYLFDAPELKAANHRLDGALWPRGSESGTPEQPVVLLEVFLAGVHWLSLEELGQQPGLDPLLSLLTLPVLPNPEIPGATEQILQPRPIYLRPFSLSWESGFPISLARESWP